MATSAAWLPTAESISPPSSSRNCGFSRRTLRSTVTRRRGTADLERGLVLARQLLDDQLRDRLVAGGVGVDVAELAVPGELAHLGHGDRDGAVRGQRGGLRQRRVRAGRLRHVDELALALGVGRLERRVDQREERGDGQLGQVLADRRGAPPAGEEGGGGE